MTGSPTSTVTVRPIAPADFDVVADLSVRAYAALGPVHPLYEPVLRDVAQRAADGEVLVAEREGRVVGAIAIADGGPLAEISRGPDELEFRMLAVDPDAQGLGVGARLVDHVLAVARERGRRSIAISTQPSMTSAHGLYERRGFVRTPERDWSPHDPVLLITYVLDLDPICTRCGQERATGDHSACAAGSALEPPRYCGACGRRMVVQVVPTGWTARCSEHGEISSEQ